MAKSKGIFIDRDTIVTKISDIGNAVWDEFSASELKQVGTLYRCDIIADGKAAMLNFFFKTDGTTTIQVCGSNTDISAIIKTKLEEQAQYVGNVESRTCSIKKLPLIWSEKLVKYLSELENVTVSENNVETQPKHTEYIFISTICDKLVVNRYDNGTIVLQGKPAYIFSEAISFMSYCNEITLDDIVSSVNTVHNIDVKTSDVHNELKVLLKNAYSNIDPIITKILSPSLSLKKIAMEMDDYSCFVFPALRALEGYIKYLFGLKSVTVGYTFANIFSGYSLTTNVINQINDAKYQAELERLFKYFKDNRHVHFHTEQILIGTTLIENKNEADTIVNEIIELIETSYTNLFV